MNCSICGGENSTGARFCKQCGAPVPAVIAVEPASGTVACPSCGKPNKHSAKFCTSCSASLAGKISLTSLPLVEESVACPQCSARNKAAAAFCVACGQGLAQDVASANVESPVVPSPVKHKAATSPTLPPSPKHAAPDVTEKNEDMEMWDMGGDDEAYVNPSLARSKSKPLWWMLVAITIGAVAAGGYVYFSRRASAPTQIPTQVTAPLVVQNPVPATRPLIPNTQPMPPQPVAPAPSVDIPMPTVSSAAPGAISGAKAAEPKSAIAKPGGTKTAQSAIKSVSREKYAAAPSSSKTAPTTKSDAQFASPAPSKSQAEVPVANSAKSTFERELDGCRKMGLFERGVCTERAKWKYCNLSGVWDSTKPGCEVN